MKIVKKQRYTLAFRSFVGLVVTLSALSAMAQSLPGGTPTAIIHRGGGHQAITKLCIGSSCSSSSAHLEILDGQMLKVAGTYATINGFYVPQGGYINIKGGGTSDAINVGGGVYLGGINTEDRISTALCVDSIGTIIVCPGQ